MPSQDAQIMLDANPGTGDGAATRDIPREGDADRWDALTDRLIELAMSQPRIDDDGIEWPSAAAVKSCLRLLQRLRVRDMLPDVLLPAGDGGIAMERRRGRDVERFEIASDGACESIRFVESRIVDRQTVRIEP